MALLTIDTDKCKKDGLCTRECPAGIIGFSQVSGFPEVAPDDEVVCFVCGHCVAVCPHDALIHRRIPIDTCPVISEDLAINEDQAVQFLRSRRSIRFFESKPVEEEKVRRLIEIARYAPTGGNIQSVQWQALMDKEVIRTAATLAVECFRSLLVDDPAGAAANPYLPKLIAAWDNGIDSILRDAPVLIIASAPKESMNGLVDLTLALSYLDLTAPTMGLGTCWAGLLQGALYALPSLKELLGIPEGHTHHYPMMLGYPRVKYHRLPERKPPKITFR